MKTKIRIIICGFMLLLLGSACNDFLDVHPDGEYSGDDLLTDETDLKMRFTGLMLLCGAIPCMEGT